MSTEKIAQPSRNGCRGPLGIAIAIAIAIRYRYRSYPACSIASSDIDSERTTITRCGLAALGPLWLKNLSSLSVFFRAFRGDNASVSGDSTPLPQQKDTPR
uniref:Uncharacterized protein n=2 Tax=Candidatus Kentrum sp. FM TaxID=2126340 RepID=A0A450TQD9_9GAMM|nr:MAG: hypothetical protein BECKFM1743C_GA0114222_105503 [Candidatus Kentron sp. FM]VFJ73451.1 MAG: hypothetical protein BECKFM1743A_GA0114220_107193 [Candidatus Kentron sp. FM]